MNSLIIILICVLVLIYLFQTSKIDKFSGYMYDGGQQSGSSNKIQQYKQFNYSQPICSSQLGGKCVFKSDCCGSDKEYTTHGPIDCVNNICAITNDSYYNK